ncbi:MAG TPA: methylated-DNA--[protein]-cysteine S-methyltransferase [Polyangiaceae bacterium]|nr:methylated-DNA--[protein]-cysteine S-methyltransferase [Polyangiaceae bacterium]
MHDVDPWFDDRGGPEGPAFERQVPSPVGPLRLVASASALVGLYFPGHRGAPAPGRPADERHPVLAQAEAQLREYFAGRRLAFSLPLAPRGTPFQRRVWRALVAIGPGETRSYAELARGLGRPTAARAAGAANAKNPLSIVVPCHRVVGSGGALTGYAGGLERKAWLLAHERALGGRPRPG